MRYTAILVFLFLIACSEPPRPVPVVKGPRMLDDTLLKYNHGVVAAENQEIDDFIARYRWNMKRTETGLRWMIFKHGNGKRPLKGDIVAIKYSVSSIDGDLLSGPGPTPLEFETGRARVPNGLEEGVLLMKAGDRAKLVVPSHLAFGLLGDTDKIKGRETLIYDLELCTVKPGKH